MERKRQMNIKYTLQISVVGDRRIIINFGNTEDWACSQNTISLVDLGMLLNLNFHIWRMVVPNTYLTVLL